MCVYSSIITSPFIHPTICSADTTYWPQLILTCPDGTSLNELPFPSTDIPSLREVTSFLAQGENNTRGPFTSIPSNICWMSNLTILNLTYNQLGNTLNFSNILNCSIPWKIVDLSYNYLITFPSRLFTLNRFDEVYLNDNQLTAFDLSIVALVQIKVDLRNNEITLIINPTNYNISLGLQTGDTVILLDGNPMLDLNDGIYEMYGSCDELQQAFADTLDGPTSLTRSLINIDFGTTQVYCSCNQYYILQMLQYAFGFPVIGRISNLLCANEPVHFVNYTCALGYSTFDFTQVQPRLCQLTGSNMTTILTTSSSTTTVTTQTTTSTTTTITESSTTTTTSQTTTSTTTTITESSTTTTTSQTTTTTITESSTTTTTSQTTTSTTTMVTQSSTTSQTTTSTTTTITESSTTTTTSQTTTSTTTTITESSTTTTTSQTTTSTTTTITESSTTSTTSQTTASTTTTITESSTTSTTSQTTASTTTTSQTTASTTTTSQTTASTTTTSQTTASTTTTFQTTVSITTTITESSTTTTTSQTTTSTTTTITESLTTTTTSQTTTSTTTMVTISSTTTTTSQTTTLTTSSTTITSTSTLNISTCLTTFSISNTNLLLTCPSNGDLSLLPINNYALSTLDRITSLKIEGYNDLRGPLETIPPNICFLTNLQVLNISFNRLNHLDSSFFSSNPSCLVTLRILDMSNNYLNQFPSLFLTKIINLQQLFLENNQLTSFDLALFVLVSTSINLSNNQISQITNNANFNISTYDHILGPYIDLTNNSQIIDLTDAIYEMYGACYEIEQIFNSSIPSITPLLTIGFLNINFGRSKINCNCNQYYIQKSFIYSFGDNLSSTYPLSNTMCTDKTLFYNNPNTSSCSSSSVNFTNIIPHLCKINPNDGNIILVNITDNITEIYPYYLTQTMNNSYCLFIFYIGGIRVSIDCINGSSTLSDISSIIFNNIYFENITQVIINNQNSITQLPAYLCFLPSNSIDLSNQSFISLDYNTFPCLSNNNTLKNINLSYNEIRIVNLTLINWIFIDLISNNLTQLPYTLLNSNENIISSRQLFQRTILLQLNKLTQFDLFIYTYPNININLQNNPFTKTIYDYNIINNYQNKSLLTGPVSTNIILLNQMHFLLNDQIAQNYNTCDSKSLNNLINIFKYMQNNNNIIIDIECQCSSFYIKEYYYLLNSPDQLTNQFSCSNISNLSKIQFENLTEIDCLSNIILSSNRLCQFARLENSSVSNNSISNDNNQFLAVILGSVLGSVGFILLIILIIICIYYKHKSSSEPIQTAALSRTPYLNNNHLEERIQTRNIPQSYDLPPLDFRTLSRSESIHDTIDYLRTGTSHFSTTRDASSHYIASIDRLQQETNHRRKQRRRPKEPPIDYDINS